MSLLCLKTRDLSWQDRTINVELMVAPTRSQLLYNKHKGLTTKCEQESSNLEREKSSYLRSFKTEQRLMERKREMYAKRRNDIILRRCQSGDGRSRTSLESEDTGRKSAPPRLQRENSKGSSVFLTQIGTRETQSAEPSTRVSQSAEPNTASHNARLSAKHNRPVSQTCQGKIPTVNQQTFTPELGAAVTPGLSTPTLTPTPGKPYLGRRKSVRFQPAEITENTNTDEQNPMTIEDKIKLFLSQQDDFNNQKMSGKSSPIAMLMPMKIKSPLVAKRYSFLQLNMMRLEKEFDEFIEDKTPEGLQKLVRYATKMKASVRVARNASIVPSVATIKGSQRFKRQLSANKRTSVETV